MHLSVLLHPHRLALMWYLLHQVVYLLIGLGQLILLAPNLSDDEFPPFPATSEYLPKERLYEIFSQVSSSAVDDIIDLYD